MVSRVSGIRAFRIFRGSKLPDVFTKFRRSEPMSLIRPRGEPRREILNFGFRMLDWEERCFAVA